MPYLLIIDHTQTLDLDQIAHAKEGYVQVTRFEEKEKLNNHLMAMNVQGLKTSKIYIVNTKQKLKDSFKLKEIDPDKFETIEERNFPKEETKEKTKKERK